MNPILDKPAAVADGAPPVELPRHPRPSRILLAFHDADTRSHVAGLLGPHYEIVALADGQTIWDAAYAAQPDLILIDVIVPGSNGLGLMQALRADPRTRKIPIIMMPPREGGTSFPAGMEDGADDYLCKPFSEGELLARVKIQLEVARLRHALARESSHHQERASHILDSIPDAFFAVDFEWRLSAANQRAEEILAPLRKTRQSLAGSILWDEFSTILETPLENDYRRAMEQRVVVDTEIFYPPLNGWFAIRIFPSREGLSVFFQDITTRKRTEEALRQQHEWFAITLASIGDAVITTSVDGRVTFLNPVAEKMTGWTMREAVGRTLETVFNIIHEQTRQPVEKSITQALREGVTVALANNSVLLNTDGTETAIEDSAAPIRAADGKIIGAVMVFHDVTERRRAVEALEEAARLAALRGEISSALVTGETLQAVLQQCAAALVKHLDGAFARIWTLHETENVLELQASAGLYTHRNGPHGRVKVGEFKIGRIAQNAQALLTNDVLHDPNISDPEWARTEGMIAFAGYPMMLDGRVLGVLAMFARHPLSEAVLSELAPIAAGISEWVHRRRVEERILSQKALLETLTESVPDGILIVSPEGGMVHFNQRFLKIWKFPREVLESHSDEDALQWAADQTANPEMFLARVTAAYAEPNKPVREEVLMKDGRAYERYGFPLRSGDSRLGWVWTFRDITERKRAEEKLRESEARLQSAVDVAELSPYSWNPATGALEWDARLKAMWGLPPEAHVDYGVWLSRVHPEDRARVEAAVARSLEPDGDGIYRAEFRVIGLDGVERWISAVGRNVFQEGKLVSFTGAARNISERKRAERALREANELLADKAKQLESLVEKRTAALTDTVQQLETFSYSIVHDMRAPLRSMQSFAQILQDEYGEKLDVTAVDYMARIASSAARLDALITDVLSYSQVSMKEVALQRVSLDKLTMELVEQYPQFQEAAARIKVNRPLPTVLGNQALLTQVLSNLLGNALKFIPTGVEPIVTVRAESLTPGGRVRLWVEDNGIGIAAEHCERIFGLFQRLHRPDQYAGTGVGLAIVKKAVERMGGSVGVLSHPGAGSRFWVELNAVPSGVSS